MAEILKLRKLVESLRSRAARALQDSKVIVAVGYTAAYALYVHERVEMKWKGLPRGAGFKREGKVVIVPTRVLKTGKVGGGGKGFYWDPPGRGQAKFLEQPARELSTTILPDIVKRALEKKKTLAQGLLLAGLRLQRESMLLVPVDTGNLKASAFTRLESAR